MPPLLRDAIREANYRRRERKKKGIILAFFALAAGIAAVFMTNDTSRPLPGARLTAPTARLADNKDADRTASLLSPSSSETASGIETAREIAKTETSAPAEAAPKSKILPDEAKASSPAIIPKPAPDEGKAGKAMSPEKDSHLYAARTHELKKDYRKAVDSYAQALVYDPQNCRIMNNAAGDLIQLGSFNEAADYASRALGVNRDYAPALVNLAIAEIHLGRLPEAEANLERALVLEPANREVLLNIGLLHERRKSFQKADEFFARLAGLGDARGCIGRGRISENMGKTEEALNFYHTAMSIEKKDSTVRTFAGQRISELTGR